mgnify:CR=1 FL=1
MNRRNFIKAAGLTSALGSLPLPFHLYASNPDFAGKFLVTVQAEGGWDVSSLCDPKMNVPGEDQINHWAINDETRTAGNIQYAAFANNQSFFDKYHQDILVINGIDSQTNSHTAGVTHNWSGRISEGYPTLTALYAAANAPALPIAYINNGGYAETAGLTRYTRLHNGDTIKRIVEPNVNVWDGYSRYVPPADWRLITEARNQRMDNIISENKLNLRQKLAVANYKSSIESASILGQFSDGLSAAGNLSEDEQFGNFWSSLRRQSELALIAMKTGVCVSADLTFGGFDTHEMHDTDHNALFSRMFDGIDYFWQYAEQLGLADRIVMMITSDFSRTPYYNETDGKDHWPVGSAIIMERGAPWGNRMVGLTDEAQNVIPINPTTMQPDPNSGKIIYPKHVMQSLREYMGVADHSLAQPFKFNNAESFNFFNADVSTPQGIDPRNLVRV